jgi:hypothetical protein
MIEEKTVGFKAREVFEPSHAKLDGDLSVRIVSEFVNLSGSTSNRYYYDPLSAGRDGRAMGRRELTT